MAVSPASSPREDDLPIANRPQAALRVETLLQTVTDAFIQLDCDGRINGWNARAEKIYHWSAAEAIGMSADVLTPEEDRAEVSRLFRKWLACDKDLIFEEPWRYRARRRNGEVFVAQLTAARLHGGEPGLMFLVRDLTEQRALRDALVKTEERYQTVLRNIEEGYFEVDHSGMFTFVTEAFAETFGYTPAEMTGKSYKEFYPPEEIPRIRSAFNTVWRTGTPRKSLECLIVGRDGSSRFAEDSVSLKRDRKGDPIGFIGIRRDITDRKLSEEALRASEAKWRDLFERASDLVYSTDAHGRLTGMNPVGEQITGYSREELLGSPVRLLVAPESMIIYKQIRSEILAGKAGTVHDIEIITKGGQRKPLELNVNLLMDKGKRIGVVGIARDMTSRRRTVRFEQGRAVILEGIARDVPLDSLLRDITALVDSELPGSCCAVIMRDRDVPRIVSAFPDVEVGARDLAEEHAADGTKDGWWVPVFSAAGRFSASIAVTRPPHASPDPEERSFLQKITELAAVTIDHRCFTAELAYQACHDSLTGLLNRRCFEERLQQMTGTEGKAGKWALLWLDLDQFKHINDTHGHRAGDLLLVEVSRRLRAHAGETGIIGRLGGDEFAAIVSGAGAARQASQLAEAVLSALRVPMNVPGEELFITASVGIAMYPQDGTEAITLLRNADRAMYAAKSVCRGQYRFFTPEMGRAEAERLEIEKQLRHAIEFGGLELFYQPQCTPDGELRGLEALARFRHPTLGYVPPARFIPIAEESGMIAGLGSWVLREVCRQGVEWARRGYPPVRLAVNVSAIQFAQEGFAEQVLEILRETGLPASMLELELTETAVMSNPEACMREMCQLRALGVNLAIDDFGTGYSSLNYLHRLKVDRLKIDRSFVFDLNAQISSLPVVESIMALARTFRTEVVAEGVESELQLRMVRDLGCDLVQGYYFSRPIPSSEIERIRSVSADPHYRRHPAWLLPMVSASLARACPTAAAMPPVPATALIAPFEMPFRT